MEILQILAIGILGRLAGSDFPFTHKWVTSFLMGCLFLPNYELAGIVFLGFFLAEVKRDSLFYLLWKGWSKKEFIKITLASLWYAPLFIAVGIYLKAILLPTFLLRGVINRLCFWIPLPSSANHTGSFWNKFLGGRAEIYELLFNIAIGVGLVWTV